jgi:hypothetical protein
MVDVDGTAEVAPDYPQQATPRTTKRRLKTFSAYRALVVSAAEQFLMRIDMVPRLANQHRLRSLDVFV